MAGLTARLPAKQADVGFKFAVTLSVAVHVLAIGGMIAGGLIKGRKEKPLMQVLSVGLADPQMAQLGGKERKAPAVMRKVEKQQPKPKEVTKKAPPKIEPTKDQIGLNRDKKPVKEKEPAASIEKPQPTIEQPKKRTNVGGTGGSEESGVAFDLSSDRPNLDQNVEFIEYYRLVLGEVGRRWTKGGLDGGSTAITFEILRDGAIQHVEISESSGRAFLDGPAKRAVLGARLPPLPQGYKDDRLIFTIRFRYGE